MKRILRMSVAVLLISLGSSLGSGVAAQYYDERRDDVSYQTFYDELSPHGRWMEYPGYGYVWIPDAGPDFRPYSTNGHWVWTEDYEWMWVSDYDWGWAPFHYGRWEEDPYYGWFWVPGYEWSPAWVAWRDGGDYYGWAPLRPGINISINFNIGSYSPPYNYWSFAPRRYITSRNIFNFCVDWRRNVTIIHQTTIINNYNYNRNVFRTGPRRYDAERFCGRISPVRFRDSYSPGRTFYRNNEVSVYRPQVRQDQNRNYAPRQFDRFERREGNGNNNRFERNNGNVRNNGNNRNENTRVFNHERPSRREFGNRENTPIREPGNNNPQDRRRFDRGQNNNGNDNRNPRVYNNDRPNRENSPVRQPGNNNLPERRRIDRVENNNGYNNDNTGPREERRVFTPGNRPERSMSPGNNGNNDGGRFDRNSGNGNRNNPVRQPEIHNDGGQRQPPVMRNNNGGQRQPPQQMQERREERPRQFERRNEHSNSSGDNNARGRGRGRF